MVILINLRAKRGGSLFEGSWYGMWSAEGSPPLAGFWGKIGPKNWNLLTKLGQIVGITKAESASLFIF